MSHVIHLPSINLEDFGGGNSAEMMTNFVHSSRKTTHHVRPSKYRHNDQKILMTIDLLCLTLTLAFEFEIRHRILQYLHDISSIGIPTWPSRVNSSFGFWG